MSLVEGFVWCDYYGTVHEDTEDPESEGPRYPQGVEREGWEGSAWVERTDHKDYQGTLMWFVCPGPHSGLEVVGGTDE